MTTYTVTDETHVDADRLAEIFANPGFGDYFTDHIAVATWTLGEGWHDHQIVRTDDFKLHPSAAVLHYGQEIFEGLKAYRHPDNSVWLFRPDMNAARFQRSAQRMAMPELPVDDFIAGVTELVQLDQMWVPDGAEKHSLYVRPFMFANERLIGVRDAHEYIFCVLAMPAGPFYPLPLTLWVPPTFSRTAPGGTGQAKCGGNYAASMAGEIEAHAHGCDQVLWLDSATRSHVEEGGTMNFMMVTADNELVTPKLTGSILDGVTRDSLLHLASDHGLTPVERTVGIDELRRGIEDGSVRETFACGTAAVISPIVGLKSPEWEVQVGDGTPGAKTTELRDHLTGIQFGTEPDTRGWTVPVTP